MARYFADNGDYLLVDTAVLTSTPFSISVWFNAANTSADESPLVFIGDKDSATQYWSVELYGGVFEITARAAASYNSYVEATVGYSTNTWEHGVGVFTNANSRTVYFNGGNSATNTEAGGVTGADRTAIARTADATPFGVEFATSIAEVGIWNRALAASEITALAAGYAPSYFKNGLVAYYPLIGKVDPETDLKGGVNLTSTGAGVSSHPKIIYPH